MLIVVLKCYPSGHPVIYLQISRCEPLEATGPQISPPPARASKSKQLVKTFGALIIYPGVKISQLNSQEFAWEVKLLLTTLANMQCLNEIK